MADSRKETTLTTQRLLLRPFRLTDVDDVFEYVSEPGFAPFVPDDPPPSSRRLSEMLVTRHVNTDWRVKPTFAIVLDSTVIGGVDLTINEVDQGGELGYSLARAQWGQGLATEAVRAVIGWGFEERGLARIYASADIRNLRSWRVMEKLGMTRERILRSNRKRRGVHIDDVYYGMLRSEWEANKGGGHCGSARSGP